MSNVEDEIAIGCQFQDKDGYHRHVWNVHEERVHYFIKAEGSHWTPVHGLEEAPTATAFRAAWVARTVSPAYVTVYTLARALDLGGDY
ncbi:hypothetical protein [Caulobacter sp. S45]|uniref:hypothetical protein n=1 Tax=Caulobacter sp. S45 TaxID=1641861 RepID=UPI00157702DB|nr:hypothetical protein [Caulobacter sp. S45]